MHTEPAARNFAVRRTDGVIEVVSPEIFEILVWHDTMQYRADRDERRSRLDKEYRKWRAGWGSI